MTLSEQSFGILFVDDEEKALKYFRRIFEKQYPVYTAESVAKAKMILDERHEEIGVLVTDQRMPEDKGVELLKYARTTYPLITRMLTTAYSDLTDAIESVNSGEILRYIPKPWDIQNLKTEVSQGMTFFSLRHERDMLMREKISARQRLSGVNRIRSLVSMASGFTHTRNPHGAARAIIEQLPSSHENRSDPSNLGAWGELREDLETIRLLAHRLIAVSSDGLDNSSFTTLSIDELLNGLSDKLQMSNTSDSEIQIEAHKPLLKEMLTALISWLGSENEAVEISARASEGGVTLTLQGSRLEWGETSISNITPKLMCAFFFCYHHGGSLKIRPDQPFVVEAFLPSNPLLSESRQSDLDWLDDALKRYENW